MSTKKTTGKETTPEKEYEYQVGGDYPGDGVAVIGYLKDRGVVAQPSSQPQEQKPAKSRTRSRIYLTPSGPRKSMYRKKQGEITRVPPEFPDLLTVSEVSAWLRYTDQAIYSLVRQGKIPHLKIPHKGRKSKILFPKDDLIDWYKNLIVAAKRASPAR